jgi:hypothetical protein
MLHQVKDCSSQLSFSSRLSDQDIWRLSGSRDFQGILGPWIWVRIQLSWFPWFGLGDLGVTRISSWPASRCRARCPGSGSGRPPRARICLAASVLKSSIKEVEHQVCWRTSGAKEAPSSLRSKLGGICIFLVNRRFLIFYSATALFT